MVLVQPLLARARGHSGPLRDSLGHFSERGVWWGRRHDDWGTGCQTQKYKFQMNDLKESKRGSSWKEMWEWQLCFLVGFLQG